MGAWGYGPFDNDSASDFWYDLRDAKDPAKFLKKMLDNAKQGYEDERRAAAAFVHFLSRFDRRVLNTLKKDAHKAIKDLLDSDYVENWKDPTNVKRSLKKELNNLK